MNFYCIKCLVFRRNRDIKIKCKTDGKNNLYCCSMDCGFKKFETIDEEDLSYLLKALI